MLDILHQDDCLIIVSKPSGMLVHRTFEAPDRETAMTVLRNQIGAWVYSVHRIDRGASGALLFAKDPVSARFFAEAFEGRRVKKTYLAVVRGWLPDSGEVDSPIIEEPGKAPMPARTTFMRLAQVELPHAVGPHSTARYSLVQVEPETGRRHQIRRHMAHLRHPLVGDVNHGDGKHNRLFRELFGLNRLLLHARALEVPHPSGGTVRAEAPLPEELRVLFERLGWELAVSGRRQA